MQLQSGTLLQGGKYKIERVLGQGGFGITYLATQVGLNRKVAIKEFFMREYCNRDTDTSQVTVGSEGSRDVVDKFRSKFVKEAQNIACLKHPHIISIYDVFEDNGTAYYVMEYLDHGSLAELVKQRGRLSEADALSYIRQIADALRYIHARKMNHLDVKPGNILIDETDGAVLIDFGLSKRYDDEGNQTSTTPVGISHGYAPLEQYKKGGVGTFSPSTDIYSLGATLYRLVTGETPPDANDVNDEGLPAFPSCVSPSVARAIEQAMQPRRKDRPQSVDAFLALLDAEFKIEDEATVSDVARSLLKRGSVNIAEEDETSEQAKRTAPSIRKTRIADLRVAKRRGGYRVKFPLWKILLFLVMVCIFSALFISFWPRLKNGDNKTHTKTTSVAPQSLSQVQTNPTQSQQLIKTHTELYVLTTPSGANVYVDGRLIGETPITKGEKISLGEHTITLSKEGCETKNFIRTFGNEPIVLNETLAEKPKPQAQSQPHQSSFSVSSPTTPLTGKINGHEWVDLGLSVKWATCNVGSSSPSDYGNYYAWGETSTKSNYSSTTSNTYGSSMGGIAGSTSYDAARANWGASWRLPTQAEFQELEQKCSWTWTTQGVHKGYLVIGPSGKSIFLPATGWRDETSIGRIGEYGHYWSATPSESHMAYYLYFHSASHNCGANSRYIGRSVRPVTE